MIKRLYTALLTAAIAIFSSQQLRAEDYLDLVGQADKAARENKWSEAEQLLRQAMRLEPANPSNILLTSNLGMIQFYDGRSDEAIATLSQAHSMAPASVTILLNRARVLTSAGRNMEAEADYTTVISLDSTLSEPRFYRAMLLLDRGDIDRARADIESLQKQAPTDRLTAIARATLCIQTGQWTQAIPLLSEAIAQQPDATYYGQRAFCRLMTDDVAGAAEDIASGIQLDPTDGELYLYRAMLNQMRFRPDDARTDALQAIKFGVDAERAKPFI